MEGRSASRLGAEVRRRRVGLGLTQTQLGQPFTRAYVSSVEAGRRIPSLSALLLIAERLQTTSGELLDTVKPRLARVYTAARGSPSTPRGPQRPA